ncbi:hypothetical protein RUM43_008830 [Polyplax serrata]|uniref:Uncharacterized protein n=1 Tax=Polyplax serrata TaxID=468196 RepID=A0AAN8P9V5_POLSC
MRSATNGFVRFEANLSGDETSEHHLAYSAHARLFSGGTRNQTQPKSYVGGGPDTLERSQQERNWTRSGKLEKIEPGDERKTRRRQFSFFLWERCTLRKNAGGGEKGG